MARTNKYTSINFNHILEKNHPSSATAAAVNSGASTKPHSSSYSSITSPNNSNTNNTLYKSHGRMLVLTRPTPKPLPTNPPLSSSPQSQTLQPQTQIPDRIRPEPAPDQISLRPLGRTGTGPEHFTPVPAQEKDKEVGSIVIGSPKTGKFVPPHLRPGFAGKEEKPAPEVSRSRESGQKYFGSPGRYGEDGRPKSGGYDKTRKGGESELGLMNRPRSSGKSTQF